MGGTTVIASIISMSVFGFILYWGSMIYSYMFSRQGRNINARDYYECGFKSVPDSKIVIDINFSIIGLIFLIYEMEIILLVPLLLNWYGIPIMALSLTSFFILILGLSYWYEWEKKAFNWVF